MTESDLKDREAFVDAMSDVAAGRPAVALALASTGIADQDFTVGIDDFSGSAGRLQLTGKLELGVSLPAGRRGAHMSRFLESLYAVTAREWSTFPEFLTALARDVAERQDTARARVTASATTVLSRATAITRQISRDRFHVHGEVSLDGESLSGRIGLSTTIITACPCTQAYSWSDIAFELAHTHGVELANEILPRLVTFTHSQRASACVTVDIVAGGPSLGHCYTALCDGAHTVNELLKRPDEHDLVQRAHARPQFSEDVVRDIAAALVGAVGDARVPSPCRVTVESEAVESIHSHSVDSRLDLTLEELRGALPAEQR